MSYRFKRRAFLASIGGAFGLRTMLDNLEASAAGVPPPPRLLVIYWPVGTIRYHFVPSGSGTTYTTSRILQPFETAGLREDLSVLYGFTRSGLNAGGGGGDEFGTVAAMTGASSPGTRVNGGEADDSCAGGPSWDQILLKNVPNLARRDEMGAISGRGFYNAIGDSRVDSYETGSRCLSYSYQRVAIQSARPGGSITENQPLQPTLSPLTAYNDLFSGFVPGGPSETALRALRLRKSVLDSALRDLARLHALAPASERPKIDIHTDAIRQLERQLSDQIDGGMISCTTPGAPSATITGKSGDVNSHYSNPIANVRDDPMLEQAGAAHLAIIRAAFQCDLIRVATFQWCPGTNHVSFGGVDPAEPNRFYMHHPLSHRNQQNAFYMGAPPSTSTDQYIFEVMTNIHTWYNQKTADALVAFKGAVDAYGGNLLAHTVVPMLTNVPNGAHATSPMPALVLGGSALGMRGGQYQNFESALRPHNNLWLSVARAYLGENAQAALAGETFAQNPMGFTGPIPGLWSP